MRRLPNRSAGDAPGKLAEPEAGLHGTVGGNAEVDDLVQAAAFQGGVSGNAGLFSNAREVAQVYQMLLNGGELNGQRYLSKETCLLFTAEVSKISRRGLGFDKPDTRNEE